MKPLLTIQHQADCPPGRIGSWLRAAGAELQVVRPDLGEPLPPAVDGYAGLLVLGGSMGANDDASVPWLAPTKKVLLEAVTKGVPTLGICLGHQLLSVACGGQVIRNPAGRRMGVVDLELTAAAQADPLFAALPRPAAAARWNQDVVAEVPADAVVLATADGGIVHGLRVGPAAWGVQVHPEATPDIVQIWADRTAADAPESAPQVDAATSSMSAADARLGQVWQPFVRAFAARLAFG